MLRFLPSLTLLLCGLLLMPGCETGPPIVPDPLSCQYDIETLTFSDPQQCTPELVRFTGLDKNIGYLPDAALPPLPEDCTNEGIPNIVELPGVDDDGFTLHVYNSTANELQLRVYGATSCDRVEPVTECLSLSALTEKVRVTGLTETYTRFFARFTLGTAPAAPPLTSADFIALAAYDDAEPGSAGSIGYNYPERGKSGYPDNNVNIVDRLHFNCDGTAFQRLLLSTCGEDEQFLREWAKMTGLPISEQYYGPLGNVVVLDIPEGMDINTGGDGARTMPGKINTGDGTAEPDYLVNLFNPETPSTTGGGIVMVEDDPEIQALDLGMKYFFNILHPFAPRLRYDQGLRPVVVSFIDSGVDITAPNDRIWASTIYTDGPESEYVKRRMLGFDFIAKDHVPDDRTPHGTYVAGALINQYQRDNPLRTVHFRTFGEEGISSYFGALVSIYEAATIGSDIINMSWGIEQPRAPQALDCAIDIAIQRGSYLITSAGNEGHDLNRQPQWPASFAGRYPERMLAVASYWYEGHGLDPSRDPDAVALRSFSNFGEPATGLAAYMTASVPAYGGGVAYPLGTSISAPVVASRLAERLTVNPNDGIAELRRLMGKAGNLSGATVNGLYLPLSPLRTPKP